MTLTLCLRPVAGEPREIVKYQLPQARTVVAVPARHLVERVGVDPDDGATPAVWFVAATQRARPVHVRLDLVARGGPAASGGRLLGTFAGSDGEVDVYGTYLGPVSEEN